MAKPVAAIANWVTSRKNAPLRQLLDAVAKIDAEADLPEFYSKTAADLLKTPIPADPTGPAFGKKKVAIYATCFVDYNAPDTAVAAARLDSRSAELAASERLVDAVRLLDRARSLT